MNRRSIVWGLTLSVIAAAGVVGAHRVARADSAVAADSPGAGSELHGWLKTALESVDLRPEQRTQLEQLKADLLTQAAPVKEAHERASEAVAQAVEAGSLDHATIDPLVSAVRTAAEANRPAFETAANRLHAILDAGQREQLVTALRNRMLSEHALHGHGQGDHLAAVGAKIGLTDDQLTTIRAKLAAAGTAEPEGAQEGMRSHFVRMHVIAAAFESESFDAHSLGIGEHSAMMSERATKMLAHLDAALPVLTAPQRTQLAQLIRSHQLGR